ncbi:pyrroline-5-carboxylate reductase [Flexivirga caeni]|uniref:Pyrroline-5-carboxylate reductase n=1 Tax=Flexivirga caeni TaxID=2294115 RepID=A0A3M9MJX0_9MICO|nr:pyrroline-5-carboxylate reductase [Flexivirga caeni]RNI25173.1 pyrroline-5-carboxylate reductase [Flexivirga caeni]
MSEPDTPRIAVLGVGAMGTALLTGLLQSDRPARISVSDRSAARQAEVADEHGVAGLAAADAVADADVVLLAVKPQGMAGLLAEIGPRLSSGALVLSIAAGLTTAYLEERLPDGTPVVRAMPNTPALVGEGMTAVCAGAHATDEHLDTAQELLGTGGRTVVVPESQLDAVTAVSGSGPAYVFYVADAMIEAGVLLGLPRDVATELAVQTLYGAATMLSRTGEHPVLLRERVSSPAGTTIAALRQLDEHGVRAAFLSALEAAAHRSAELASEQG